jgi:coenzyme F420-reducing hydrogenase gamma subunit
MSKPKVGIFGLTGCAGDQLVILNCEDELLDLVELIDIKSFIMASSAFDDECELDVALVEGAVVTDRDEQILRRVRERSKLVVALGTCALWGGVPAANRPDWGALMTDVYGAASFDWAAVQARPLSGVVKVDAAITGCPIEKHELLTVIAHLLQGQLPVLAQYPVCTECKMRENVCLIADANAFCCGPVTVAGCNARCPSLGVACVGCRGPAVDANFAAAAEIFAAKGYSAQDIRFRLGTFSQVAGVS